jgi:hypothetical protein
MTLRTALAWSKSWFVRHESLWSIARKLATAQMASLQQVLRNVLCPCDAPGTTLFLDNVPGRSEWLHQLLGLDHDDVQGFWLDSTLANGPDHSLSTGLRYCPQCMERQFHSTLFQSYLVGSCPLHGTALTTRCPRCGGLKGIGAVTTDSFAWCPRCEMDYFPERGTWLHDYSSPRAAEALGAVAASLARRAVQGHLESAVNEWAREPGKVIPAQMPAYALLGDALRGLRKPFLTFECALRPGADFVCPTWDVAFGLAQAALVGFERLGVSAGVDPNLPLWRVAQASDSVRATYLTRRWVGVPPYASAAEVCRSLRNLSLSPMLCTGALPAPDSGGFVTGEFPTQACVDAVLHSVYLDALAWVRRPESPHSWDQWPLNRDPAHFPSVWVGHRLDDGRAALKLFGPCERDVIVASKLSTESVGL